MSELINDRKSSITRQYLLATASVLVLVAGSTLRSACAATDDERPTVWIELGGQLERVDGNPLPFVPSFSATALEHGFSDPASVEKGGRYGYGGEGSIEFHPEDSQWRFFASVRYGRSNAAKSKHEQTKAPKTPNPFGGSTQPYFTLIRSYSTADYRSTFGRNSTIVDFQAGRDVGLGLFVSGRSNLGLGIRFAQFTNAQTLNAYGIPYPHWGKTYVSFLHMSLPLGYLHQYHATAYARRSFSGVGPSLTWKGSAGLLKLDPDTASLEFGWQLNAAVLFGRQKAAGHFHTKELIYDGKYQGVAYQTGNFDRNRSVVVPNLGGQASLSLKFPNAKVTFGYRADFFFRAMDGGINVEHRRDLSFLGPFATISIGLGG